MYILQKMSKQNLLFKGYDFLGAPNIMGPQTTYMASLAVVTPLIKVIQINLFVLEGIFVFRRHIHVWSYAFLKCNYVYKLQIKIWKKFFSNLNQWNFIDELTGNRLLFHLDIHFTVFHWLSVVSYQKQLNCHWSWS